MHDGAYLQVKYKTLPIFLVCDCHIIRARVVLEMMKSQRRTINDWFTIISRRTASDSGGRGALLARCRLAGVVRLAREAVGTGPTHARGRVAPRPRPATTTDRPRLTTQYSICLAAANLRGH
ncbi:unnamed protein product [Colias eurytheme]|nr:unnamed protein product [Colias eurytheme]